MYHLLPSHVCFFIWIIFFVPLQGIHVAFKYVFWNICCCYSIFMLLCYPHCPFWRYNRFSLFADFCGISFWSYKHTYLGFEFLRYFPTNPQGCSVTSPVVVFHLGKGPEGDSLGTDSEQQRKLLKWLQFGAGHLDCILVFILRQCFTELTNKLVPWGCESLASKFSYHCGLWKSRYSNHLSLLDCSEISN